MPDTITFKNDETGNNVIIDPTYFINQEFLFEDDCSPIPEHCNRFLARIEAVKDDKEQGYLFKIFVKDQWLSVQDVYLNDDGSIRELKLDTGPIKLYASRCY